MAQTCEAECPECSGRLNTEGTETVCGQCGLVVDEYRIDHGPEWRSFADDYFWFGFGSITVSGRETA